MKVVVMLSTYNPNIVFLKEQIDSILNSKGEFDLSLIIRDDGSNQDIVEKLQEYNDIRIKIFYEKNIGLPGAFFQLLRLASNNADYYFFADQDDVWLDNKIDKAIEKMVTMQSENILYMSRTMLVNEKLENLGLSKSLPTNPTYKQSIISNIATGCTMGFDNSFFKLISKHTPDFTTIHMHDWWFYIVATFLGNVVVDNNAYIKYRQHSNNNVGMSSAYFFRLKTRIKRILSSDSKFSKLTLQITEFLELYKDSLTDEEKTFLLDFINRNKNLSCRFKYLFSHNIKANSKIDTMLAKILLFLGIIR